MISIQKFVFNPFQENTFVLHDESGACVIIDPGCESAAEQEMITSYIAEQELLPVKILNSHCHIDHILGISFIAKKYSIPLYIHRADLPLMERSIEQASMFGLELSEVPHADSFMEDGNVIGFGDSELSVLHLPGHSPGGLGFYQQNQGFVIVGDVLFNGSIGRTDLPGGDYDVLISSIREKLLCLDEETLVYCGHGPETTIGEEKKSNPFLS